MTALQAAPILLMLYSAAAKPAISPSPEYLLLAKVITTNTPVNRMAGGLQADTGKYAGKGSISAQMMCR
jgi:hypothetical protein